MSKGAAISLLCLHLEDTDLLSAEVFYNFERYLRTGNVGSAHLCVLAICTDEQYVIHINAGANLRILLVDHKCLSFFYLILVSSDFNDSKHVGV